MNRLLLPSSFFYSLQRSLTNVSPNLIGPAAKLLLYHYDIDLATVKPTGPKNNLLKSDLLLFIDNAKLKPKSRKTSKKTNDSVQIKNKVNKSPNLLKVKNFVDIPLNNMRSTIAKRLSQSKQSIPHSYQSISIVADNLLTIRKNFLENGYKISINDFIIKAAALSLKAVPQINVQWKGNSLIQMPSVDISVAVATPEGLLTPIIFKSDCLNLYEISKLTRSLSEKARENKLKPNEFQGGSFTISNLGMFGISHFTAIINLPQTAILTVGSISAEINEFDKLENRFKLTLCYDAKAIDDLKSKKFLSYLKTLLSNPETIISGLNILDT